MVLGMSSAAAFAPPPSIAFYEPDDRRDYSGFAPARARTSATLPNVTMATTDRPSSQVPKRSNFAEMALDLSKRVQSLRIEAELDEVPFSWASFADFVSFLMETQPQSRPSLFLNDNGNLRALWRNDAREQIGLQFLGGGNIQFVIFKRRPNADAMARITGIDTTKDIVGHIRAAGALGLLAG